ncbi:hypothetical protein [Dendrosporobacter sp. 1207_IL3150]|uniref:hypothetical protein n=1 Tax=Dendrosporobacter sp. 1207_IL3150 TaxID=3084054 RepID=UPI002FDA636A
MKVDLGIAGSVANHLRDMKNSSVDIDGQQSIGTPGKAVHTQLAIDESINMMLEQLSKTMMKRNELLQALPQPIKNQAEQILKQTQPKDTLFSQGLSNLIKTQNFTVEQLTSLTKTLQFLGANVAKTSKLPNSLDILLQNSFPSEPDENGGERLTNNRLYLLISKLSDTTTQEQTASFIKKIFGTVVRGDDVTPNDSFKQLIESFAKSNDNLKQGQLYNGNLTSGSLANAKSEKIQADLKLLTQMVKALAQFIMENSKPQISKNDMSVLRGFLKEDVLASYSKKDLESLQNIIKACVHSTPNTIRQAAEKYNMPELQQLWVLNQLSDVSELSGLDQKTMNSATKLLGELAQSFKSPQIQNSESAESHRIMAFTTPIYLGDNGQAYPAFIHVFQQSEENHGGLQEQKRETWVRICLDTENMGIVDLMFRLYKDNNLSLKLGFTEPKAAPLFSELVPELRNAIETTPIILTDISIGSIGEK